MNEPKGIILEAICDLLQQNMNSITFRFAVPKNEKEASEIISLSREGFGNPGFMPGKKYRISFELIEEKQQ